MCRYPFEEYKKKKRKAIEKDKRERATLALLYPKDRLIHFYLNWILVPKGSNHAQCFDFELQLMYGIKNGLKIYWPFIIKSNMVKCQSSGDLPYAILISCLLNHFNVDIDENVIETSFHEQRIGLSSLAKLDIVCDLVNSKYKHKDDFIQPIPEEGVEDNPEVATNAEATEDASLLLLILHSI